MDERWAISRSPRELCSKSHSDWVLNEILWGQISNFLLYSIVLLSLWEQLSHLLLAQFCHVSNVVHGLDLIQMGKVVNHPQLVVVVHGDIEGLHGLRSGSALGNGTVHLEFGSHEISVFGLDFLDDIWGVHVLLVGGPVDWLHMGGGSSLVVVVEDGLELRVLFTRLIRVGGGSQSVQPLGGQLVV